jgi:predicted nucleic acid-binding Zn ribbon protein
MKRRKSKESTPIGSVISNVLKSYRRESDEDMVRIWSLWDDAVGEAIAQNARPEAFKGNLLLVNVISSTWAHQLQFLKKDIIIKVNKALGKALVEDIKFKIGPV